MPVQKHLIAPYDQGAGLTTNRRPWLIPDNAFSQQVNTYCFRSRILKRFGTTLMEPTSPATPSFPQLASRVFVDLPVSTGGAATGTVPGVERFAGQAFSVGDIMFTVISSIPGPQQMLRSDGSVATATYDVTNGNYNITGVANGLVVQFYPSTPIMDFSTWERGIGLLGEPVFTFDQQFAYLWGSSGWEREGSTTTAPAAGIWSGSELNFYSTDTFIGTAGVDPFFFVVNDNAADRIQYYDNTGTWNVLTANVNNGSDYIASALFVISFKNRLLFLSTWEVLGANPAVQFRNRIRYSALGNATGATSFYDIPTTTGYGGFIDNLSTQQSITGFGFILDRLIVNFEKSSYEVAYTGSEAAPFVFQKISDEYGCNSQNSPISVGNNILTFSSQGIHACTGMNVTRIDDAIPQLAFDVANELLNGEVYRTCGVRDFAREMVYWSYVSQEEKQGTSNRFPNRVLNYNYVTKNWSYNLDTFTALGSFEPGQLGGQRQRILAGNQQGVVMIIDAEEPRNAPSLQITNLTYTLANIVLTINDNNIMPLNFSLNMATYIVLEGILGTGNVATLNDRILPVVSVTTDTITLAVPTGVVLSGTYQGGGTVALVSNYDLFSKQFNPYASDGKNIFVSKIEYQVDKTENGEVTIDYYTSTSTQSTLVGAIATGAIMGTNILDTYPYAIYPLEATSTRLWHPVYFQSSGECLQFRLYMSHDQISDPLIAFSPFELHSMQIYSEPMGRLQ